MTASSNPCSTNLQLPIDDNSLHVPFSGPQGWPVFCYEMEVLIHTDGCNHRCYS